MEQSDPNLPKVIASIIRRMGELQRDFILKRAAVEVVGLMA